MSRTSAILFALVLLFFSAFAFSQTTGSIVGNVSDDSGAPLPGATVEARGPALQGTKIAVTAGDGSYRLTLLPPGSYTVSASLLQFGRAEQTVQVLLDRNVTADFRLRATAREEVIVSGEVPVIDLTSPTLGANIAQQTFQNLPTGRDYGSVVQTVPGVQTDAAEPEEDSISVYGSSSAENAYLIDGINTTNVEYGLEGKELNFEFIQEIEVKTGGYEAEYGRSTGGIINVITKSGGNEFHGDTFGYFNDQSLQADNKHVGETLEGAELGFEKKDYGVDLGGYILKDRLWFFGAYDRVERTTQNELTAGPLEGEEVESKTSRDLGSGKLTWSFAPGHTLVGSFIQDPRTDSGAIDDANHTLNGEPATFFGRQEFGGRDYSLRWDGLLGVWLVMSAQAARHKERNSIGPSGEEGDTIEFIDTRNGDFQTGGFGLIQKKNFERNHFLVSATAYFLKNHEFKGGVEYEKDSADVTKRMSGGQQVTIFDNPTNPARPIYQHFYWTTPNATLEPFNAPISQLAASPEHKIWTAYLQDRWAVLPELTLNLGIRWDRQEIIDASGVTRITLDKDFAPRLGVIWDPGSAKRTKMFGSFGLYYEEIPMDLVIRSFSFERQPKVYNFDPTSVIPDPMAEAIKGDSDIFGGSTEPSDPNLENQYVREIIVGGEREILPDIALGLRYIYRDYGQVIENFLCMGDGTYCIGNPGEGIMKNIFTLDYATTFPAPDPQRIFRGVQVDVSKRFSHNWQFLASYLWSKLSGNYDGEFAPFTDVGPDPNISAAYDYYDFFTDGQHRDEITNRGPLSNDRRHQLKVSGVYVTDFRLSLGLSAYYRTGTPLTRYGFSDDYLRYEFFLTKRGAEGRTPDIWGADLHIGYPLRIGPVTVNLLADVFNALNVQRPILLDQRYNIAQFEDADYVCQSNSSAADEPRCNRRVDPETGEFIYLYKKPFLRQAPRSLRLGARVSF